jgi:leucyl-tRNA synthetase
VADESKIVASAITLPIQINGKVRAKVEIEAGLTEDQVMEIARAQENIVKWIEGKEVKKVIWVQDKILNIIVET